MTVLFKAPPQTDLNGIVAVEAKPYGAVDLQPGDGVFLWWCEAQQGNGLSGYGECRSVTDLGDRLRAEVSVSRLASDGVGFGRNQLRLHRDDLRASPEATLAKSLYRHALRNSDRRLARSGHRRPRPETALAEPRLEFGLTQTTGKSRKPKA